jgi:LPS-assembly protein
MFKLFTTLLLVAVFAYAQEESNTNIEVTAKNIESVKNTVTGSGGVVVYYGKSVIKADTAIYNRDTELLTLDGKVEVIGYKGTKEHTSHMEIKLENDEVNFKELFLVNKNDVWIYAQKAHRVDGNYTFGRSVISSCDATNPLWKMAFENSKYDSTEEYMKIYNAKMYFMDVPVAYTPYMGFSTNKKRSSGLLFPLLGYSKDNGFIYEQPIFWAISDSMDLEVNPQIRTNRSLGGYATLRFADTAKSRGQLRVGYFKDNDSYIEEYNPLNESHYGAEFNYKSSEVFSKTLGENFTDGLYINSTYLNDIDYLTLQKTSLRHFGLSPIQMSVFNYYLNNDDYYAGVNAKYFIDTRIEENDGTLQVLPATQLHKYLSSFLVDNFTYSIDAHINNYSRKEGSTQKQVEFRVPLEFTASFLDDYINISLGEELYYSKYLFGNGDYTNDNYEYYSNFHRAKIFSDLTKKYDKFVHVLQPSVEYFKPGSETENPSKLDKLLKTNPELNGLPFAVGVPEESFVFKLSQYFYDDKAKLKFLHRISQTYYSNRDYTLSDLNNEVLYYWDNWIFYNNLKYSTEDSFLKEMSSFVELKESEYKISVGHSYTQIKESPLEENSEILVATNDLNLNFSYRYNNNINFNGALIYNVEEELSEQWVFGASYSVDCWSISASMRRDILPVPAGEAVSSDVFYLQLNFIPFGGVGLSSDKLTNRNEYR